MSDEPLLRAMLPEDGERIEQDLRDRELARIRRTCRHDSTNFPKDDCNCVVCGTCGQRIYACRQHNARQPNDARDIGRPDGMRSPR